MSRVVEELVEAARTERFFAAADAAYQQLRADPDAWAGELGERHAWEVTVADGAHDLGATKKPVSGPDVPLRKRPRC